MQICRSLAGYSLGRADIVRRAMSKKKHSVMEAEREVFIDGAVKNGIEREVANKIFDDMAAFSSYAFNKSHAAAYGYIAYQTAYLKCHYPAQYMAALITSVMENPGKVLEYISECQRLGIAILPPCVNESEEYMTVSEKGIRFGLLVIKNLGRSTARKIIDERNSGGKYRSMYDFCFRNYSREFNRRALENLIKSGALDSLEKNRRQMLYSVESVLSAAESKSRFEMGGQMDLFSESGEDNHSFSLPECEEMESSQLYALEKEATGMYLTGHPMKEYESYAAFSGAARIRDITAGEGNDNKRVSLVCMISAVNIKQLKSGQMLCTITVEDITGSIDVICFSKIYAQFQNLFTVSKILRLTGKVSEREDRPTEIVLERADVLPAFAAGFVAPKERVKPKIYIKVDFMDGTKMKKVTPVLEAAEGDCPVYIYCEADKKSYCAPERMWIEPRQEVLEKLTEILGDGNVKIVEK